MFNGFDLLVLVIVLTGLGYCVYCEIERIEK